MGEEVEEEDVVLPPDEAAQARATQAKYGDIPDSDEVKYTDGDIGSHMISDEDAIKEKKGRDSYKKKYEEGEKTFQKL